jgi:hypothetical protein
MGQQIQVWTIQIAKWRVARDKNIYFLDTTAKSGVLAFAPNFSDVMAYKRGEMSEEEYTRIYIERMALSQRLFPLKWQSIVKRPQIAFACYCPEGKFCHRHLLVNEVEKYFTPQGYEILRMGELK